MVERLQCVGMTAQVLSKLLFKLLRNNCSSGVGIRTTPIHDHLDHELTVDWITVARPLKSLGQLGRYDEALRTAEEAVRIYEKLYGQAPRFEQNLARSLNNKGTEHRNLGTIAEAISVTEMALGICRKILRDRPEELIQSELVDCLRDLSIVYRSIGKDDDARAVDAEAASLEETRAH